MLRIPTGMRPLFASTRASRSRSISSGKTTHLRKSTRHIPGLCTIPKFAAWEEEPVLRRGPGGLPPGIFLFGASAGLWGRGRNRVRDRSRTRGRDSPPGRAGRAIVLGSTNRPRGALRTMATPGNPRAERPSALLPASKEAAGARAAWSQIFPSPPRDHADRATLGSRGANGDPTSQKAGARRIRIHGGTTASRGQPGGRMPSGGPEGNRSSRFR